MAAVCRAAGREYSCCRGHETRHLPFASHVFLSITVPFFLFFLLSVPVSVDLCRADCVALYLSI